MFKHLPALTLRQNVSGVTGVEFSFKSLYSSVMALHYLLILALVQGITEFLPISSSGHLVLVHGFYDGDTGNARENLLLDVAVHVGTLFSVLLYFRRDVLAMIMGLKDWATGNYKSEGAKLDLYVLIASVPVIIAGFILHKLDPSFLRAVEIMAWATLVFGVLLWWVDVKRPVQKDIHAMTMRDALLIGLAQTLALVPGTSRSGITMTAARWLGYNRTESAHFSLLLAIVAITGAGTLASLDLLESGNLAFTLDALMAATLAFGAGWVSIALMMTWLQRATFTPFAVYRVLLGSLLLILIYSGILQ